MDYLLDLAQIELQPPLVKFLPGDNDPDHPNNTFRVSVTNLRSGVATIQRKIADGPWEVVHDIDQFDLPCNKKTYFRAVEGSRISAEVEKGPVYNVLLIGSTGVGKSKWGNYLAAYGQQQFFKVATADQTTSCSQELEAHTVEVLDGNVLLNIIDTPGLNEKEKEMDMEHMLKLFQYILQLKEITCIMLCMPWQFSQTPQTINTLKYFKRLLEPIFQARNVFLLLTKLSKETFEECIETQGTLASARDKKLATINQLLGLNIDVIECVETSLSKVKAKKVIPNCLRGVFKDKMEYKTWQARRRLIELLIQEPPVSLDPTFLFSLPPAYEHARISKTNEISALLQQVVETLKIEDRRGSMILEEIGAMNHEKQTLVSHIQSLKRQEKEKSGPQQTRTQWLSDENTWVNLSSYTFYFDIGVPKAFKIHARYWNCDYDRNFVKVKLNPLGEKEGFSVSPDKAYILKVTIEPKLFTFSKSQNYNWFIRMSVSWPGHVVYMDELDQIRTDIQVHEKNLKTLVTQMDKRSTSSFTLEQHKKRQATLQTRLNFLKQERFRLEDVPKVLRYLSSNEMNDEEMEDEAAKALRERYEAPIPEGFKTDWCIGLYEESESVLYDQKGQKLGEIEYGTLNHLVGMLTGVATSLAKLKAMFMTHKMFTTSQTLLKKLQERFFVPTQNLAEDTRSQIQEATVSMFLLWFKTVSTDWDEGMITRLTQFVEEIRKRALWPALVPKLHEILHTMTEHAVMDQRTRGLTQEFLETANKPLCSVDPSVAILHHTPQLIAQQICLVDWAYFSLLKMDEFLCLSWKRPQYHFRAQNLICMIQYYQKRCNWVTKMMLFQKTVQQRVELYGIFLNICEELRQANNFFGCDAIMKGLSHPAIQRLRATRNGLPQATSVLEVDLSLKLALGHQNYKEPTEGVPVIPFLSAFLSELEQNEENHPTFLQKEHVVVNFQKCLYITQIVSQIQQCQATAPSGYEWSVNLAITEIIQVDADPPTDKLFREMSYVLEPPGYIPN